MCPPMIQTIVICLSQQKVNVVLHDSRRKHVVALPRLLIYLYLQIFFQEILQYVLKCEIATAWFWIFCRDAGLQSGSGTGKEWLTEDGRRRRKSLTDIFQLHMLLDLNPNSSPKSDLIWSVTQSRIRIRNPKSQSQIFNIRARGEQPYSISSSKLKTCPSQDMVETQTSPNTTGCCDHLMSQHEFKFIIVDTQSASQQPQSSVSRETQSLQPEVFRGFSYNLKTFLAALEHTAEPQF